MENSLCLLNDCNLIVAQLFLIIESNITREHRSCIDERTFFANGSSV